MAREDGSGNRYKLSFAKDSVYGRAVNLIAEHAGREGVHLDLGCGFGAIAEAVSDFGLTYVGFDLTVDGLTDLDSRGFETARIDLRDVDGALAVVRDVLNDRALASVSLLDTLEHLTNGAELLAGLRELAAESRAVLVLSVPNVAHRDIAFKLLTGRFDYTPTGLLDSTHVVHHTESLLTAVTVSTGWREVGSQDLEMEQSDQWFPRDHVALAEASALHRFLYDLRQQAGPHARTNQFIRAYLPGQPRDVPLVIDPSQAPVGPFLSVLLRTQGRRLEALRDAFLCLLAQTVDDFEVVLVLHRSVDSDVAGVEGVIEELPRSLRDRTRLLTVEGGTRSRPLNVAAEAARGRYFAVLDDDDLVLAHWVESFADRDKAAPGMVLRSVCVEQPITPDTWPGKGEAFRATGAMTNPYPDRFDLIAHLGRNHTPFMSYAFPVSLFRDLGLRFDEALHVCEDWDFELRAALLAGVASTPAVTAVYRRWVAGPSSASLHDAAEWRRIEQAILTKLDASPHVFPAGTIAAIREATLEGQERVEREIQALVERNRELEEQALGMERSMSWRLTKPLRALRNRGQH